MKQMLAVMVLMVVVLAAFGCSTTTTQFGMSSGMGGGQRMAVYADPSRRVDPSQTAYKGASGHAAALALGDITDTEARQDAKEAMIAISENSSFWNRGGRGLNSVGASGQVPTLAGTSGAFGRMYNPFEHPITVLIRGLGSPYTFGPGEEQEFSIPFGRYDVVVYNTETGQLMGHNKLDTSYRRKVGDKIYDFNMRVDAEGVR